MALVDALQPAMLRVARMYVSSQAVAEEVVQEAWLGVLQGIDRFEGRSSLRTWIFRIVDEHREDAGAAGRPQRAVRLARGRRPRRSRLRPRSVPGERRSAVAGSLVDDARRIGPALPEDRLRGGGDPRVVRRAIDTLPPMQAEVIRLRDVLGWTSEEVRNALDLTETNQRVLLHRARAKVRARAGARVRDARRTHERIDRVLTCRELVEALTDYLEGAMPADDRARLEAPPRGLRRLHERAARSSATRSASPATSPRSRSPNPRGRRSGRCSGAGVPIRHRNRLADGPDGPHRQRMIASRSARRTLACCTSASLPIASASRDRLRQQIGRLLRSEVALRGRGVLDLLVGLHDQFEDLVRFHPGSFADRDGVGPIERYARGVCHSAASRAAWC